MDAQSLVELVLTKPIIELKRADKDNELIAVRYSLCVQLFLSFNMFILINLCLRAHRFQT